jgi:hypothetical protein
MARHDRTHREERRAQRSTRGFGAVFLCFLTGFACLGLLGCQRELDMAKDYDDRNAATTIRYTGVREATRQYPDYGVIRSTIFSGPAGGKGAKEGPSP